MTRAGNHKTLPCCRCEQPQRAGAEALRVLCGICVLLGLTFPRDVQLTLPGSQSSEVSSQ